MISDEWKESVVIDVQRGKLWGFPLFLKLVPRSISGSYSDTSFVQTVLGGRLAALSCEHHGLRGCPDIVLQR